MLNKFGDKNHKNVATKYNFIRKNIDEVSESRRRSDTQALMILDKYFGSKPFKNATRDDIVGWINNLKKEYENSTIQIYKANIRLFYKWLFNQKEYERGKQFRKALKYPECVEWISIEQRDNDLPVDYLLSEKQICQMIEVSDNERNRAMISFLYESGCRLSETLNLRIKNIQFDKYGAVAILYKKGKDQKTGIRRIRLINSSPYLQLLIDHHPFRDYELCPLFCSRDPETFSKMIMKKVHNENLTEKDFEKLTLSRKAVEKIVERAGKEAGIKVHTYPHLLRHSRATWAAKNGFNEQEMRIMFGWSKRSNMPSHYTHLASSDIDKKMMAAYGMVEEEEKKEESPLKPRKCPRCGFKNPASNQFCGKCSMALDLRSIMDYEKTRNEAMKKIDDRQNIEAIVEMVMKKIDQKASEQKES